MHPEQKLEISLVRPVLKIVDDGQNYLSYNYFTTITYFEKASTYKERITLLSCADTSSTRTK